MHLDTEAQKEYDSFMDLHREHFPELINQRLGTYITTLLHLGEDYRVQTEEGGAEIIIPIKDVFHHPFALDLAHKIKPFYDSEGFQCKVSKGESTYDNDPMFFAKIELKRENEQKTVEVIMESGTYKLLVY